MFSVFSGFVHMSNNNNNNNKKRKRTREFTEERWERMRLTFVAYSLNMTWNCCYAVLGRSGWTAEISDDEWERQSIMRVDAHAKESNDLNSDYVDDYMREMRDQHRDQDDARRE